MADGACGCSEGRRPLKSEHSIESLRTKNRAEYQKSNTENRFLHLFYKRTRVDFFDVKNELITAEDVKALCKKISKKSDDLENQLKSLISAFAMGENHVNAFLSEDNGLRTLVGFLTGNDCKLQIYAAYCITNISAYDISRGHFIAKSCSPYLIALLQSQNDLMQDLSACALGNIAAYSKQNRNLLLRQGVLKPLVELFKVDCPAVLESAAYALIKICANEDDTVTEILSFGIISLLVKNLKNEDLNNIVIGELAWLLFILSSNEIHTKEMIKHGAADIAFKYFVKTRHSIVDNLYTVTPFVRFLGNAVSIDGSFEFLKTDLFFSTIKCYINSNISHIVKETCWVLSNVLVLGSNFALMAVNCQMLPSLVNHLNDDKNIKTEVMICLCNIASYNSELAESITNAGVFPCLLKSSIDQDETYLTLTLQLIEILLRLSTSGRENFSAENGVYFIENLTQCENKTIHMISQELKRKYFE